MTLPSRGLGRWLTLRGVTERVTGTTILYLTSWGRHLGSHAVGAAILDWKSWGPPSWIWRRGGRHLASEVVGAAILDLTSWRHLPYSATHTTVMSATDWSVVATLPGNRTHLLFYRINVASCNTESIVANIQSLLPIAFYNNGVASESEITSCIKIDKPLVVYGFSGNVMKWRF